MKLKTLSRLIILTTLLAGCSLPPQTGQADYYYPEPAYYSQEELAQLLAPIALYPDALLAQVLMASTYPIEVIEADRWLRGNPYLQGKELDLALTSQDWAPSVKALGHFPSILALMSERIDETTDLGNAFLVQEGEVMDMIQQLRATAHAQGHLYTTAQQRIIFDGPTLIIVPATPVLYVPYYDPHTVYGTWRYPDYPPYYWAPRGATIGFGISYWPGIHFSFTFVSWSRFDWHRRHIHIDVHKRPRYVRHDHWQRKSRWRHAPGHRRGVAYGHKSTARKYGQPSPATPSRDEARKAPQHRHPDRHADNPPPRSGRQRISRPQTGPGRQVRGEKSKNFPAKQLESRPAPTGRRTDEKPGRTVWKKAGPPKQPKRHVRPEKQREKSNRNNLVGDKAVKPNQPRRITRERTRPMRQPEKAHRNQTVRSHDAKPYRTQPIAGKRDPTERQPVAAKAPKRQRTPRAAPSSPGHRRQTQSSRDKAVDRSGVRDKGHSPKGKDRVEKPEQGSDSDLHKQYDRTDENNRFGRGPSGRRGRN